MLTSPVGVRQVSLGRGFSEQPAAVHRASFRNLPSENLNLFPEFAAGGAAVRRAVEGQLATGKVAGLYYAEGLQPQARVFILKAAWQVHLLSDDHTDLDSLRQITRGMFIEVLGPQSSHCGDQIYTFEQAGEFARPRP